MAHCPCPPILGLVMAIRFTWDKIYNAEPWSLRWAIKVASVITSESLAKGSHLNWGIIWGREGEIAIQLPIPKKRSPNLKGPGFGGEDLTIRAESWHLSVGISEAFGMITVEWSIRKQYLQQLCIAFRRMMLKLLGWYSSLCPSFPSLFWQPYWNFLLLESSPVRLSSSLLPK